MLTGAQAREPDPSLGGQAVDQGARAVETNQTVEIVPTSDEVIEDMRRQMAELDARDKERDAEISRERDRASSAERSRVDAENRAREAERHAQEAAQTGQRSVETAQLDSIKNSLATHEGQLMNLASQKANYHAEGKFEEAAKLDAEMAKIGGRIAQLEAGRDELDARIKTPLPEASRQPAPQAQPNADEQRESWIRAQPPRVQDWLRSENGRRFFSDEGFRAKVSAAASFAQNVKGIAIDSADYVPYIEEQIGLRQPSQSQQRDDRQPSQPGQGRTADDGSRMVTAPAGGSSQGSVRSNPNGTIEVYLTEAEREIGRRQGSTDAELAKAKRDLINEGLIGPNARIR